MTDIVLPAVQDEDKAQAAPAVAEPRTVVVSLIALLWVAAGLVFTLLRLGIIWHAPVGGAELVHLAGAWTARTGAPDDRFVPTFFQALTTLMLHWSDSEVPARVLAFLSTATIPFAVYLLRRQLSEVGALAVLVLLSFDGLAITMGSSASAMGFDLAVTAWLFVIIMRGGVPRWGWPVVGFAVAASGPVALPLVAGWIAVSLSRRTYPDRMGAVLCVAGVLLAVILSSVRYGLGVDGLRIAPFQLFADAYSQSWTTSTTWDLFLIYTIPIVVAGIAAGAVLAYRLFAHRDNPDDGRRRWQLILLAWCGFALLWAVSSSESHATAPLVALTTALAFLVGPALIEAATAMVRANWQYARYVVPVTLFILLFFATASAGWVHNNDVPRGMSALIIVVLILVGIAGGWWLRKTPDAAPALFAIPLVIAAFPLLSMALGVAFSGVGMPTPSPTSPEQTRQLRDILMTDLQKSGGPLVVHPDLWRELTWPLRDSGKVVVASNIPADAGAAIWPVTGKKPDGMSPLEGQWNVLNEVDAPTGDLFDYFNWFTNRGTAVSSSQQAAVYVRASK